MTAKSAGSRSATDNPMLVALEAWMAFNRPMMQAWSEMNCKLLEQGTKASAEWLDFLGRRLNEDIGLSAKCAECKSLQDVFGLYGDFYQRAQRQYQDEFRQIVLLNQKFADETASLVRSTFANGKGAEARH